MKPYFPILLLVLAPPILAATGPQDPFPKDRLFTIHITLLPADYSALPPTHGPGVTPVAAVAHDMNPIRLLVHAINDVLPASQPADQPHAKRPAPANFGYDFKYVPATVECDGIIFHNVAVRYKGNASYSTATHTPKKSFKLGFDRYTTGSFAGLHVLNLNNNAMDPLEIREAVAYALFRDAGLPSPRTAFARVYLTVPGQFNHEYLGLYTLVEELDKQFLKQHFHSAKGLLLKPEGQTGLPLNGRTWNTYYDRFYNPRSGFTDEQGRRFIDFLTLIHSSNDATFQAKIASYLDVDGFLNFIALNSLVANYDSFLANGHNFYIYLDPKTNRFVFLPWDLNLAFAGWRGGAEASFSIDKPNLRENPLITRILAIPPYRAAYRNRIDQLLRTTFLPAHTTQVIDSIEALTASAISTETHSATRIFPTPPPPRARPAPTARPTTHPATRPAPPARPVRLQGFPNVPTRGPTDLKAFLATRTAEFRAQLRPATRPSTRP